MQPPAGPRGTRCTLGAPVVRSPRAPGGRRPGPGQGRLCPQPRDFKRGVLCADLRPGRSAWAGLSHKGLLGSRVPVPVSIVTLLGHVLRRCSGHPGGCVAQAHTHAAHTPFPWASPLALRLGQRCVLALTRSEPVPFLPQASASSGTRDPCACDPPHWALRGSEGGAGALDCRRPLTCSAPGHQGVPSRSDQDA